MLGQSLSSGCSLGSLCSGKICAADAQMIFVTAVSVSCLHMKAKNLTVFVAWVARPGLLERTLQEDGMGDQVRNQAGVPGRRSEILQRATRHHTIHG